MNRFSRFSWFLLVWTVLVIAFGTVVRATNSGAGCGKFWPLCGEDLIPTFDVFHTIVEFTHRMMSGSLILMVFALTFWGNQLYRQDPTRKRMVWLVLFFVLVESALGAGLVLLGLVEDNSSYLRIMAVSIHLLNTFLLLGVTTINAWWSNNQITRPALKTSGRPYVIGFIVFVAIIGATGAVTALADTLFPSSSLAHTIEEQLRPDGHILVYLRIYHPIIAIALGSLMVWVLANLIHTEHPVGQRIKLGIILSIGAQFLLGMANIYFLTPLGIQVAHLVLADVIWILCVLLSLVSTEKKNFSYE